MGIASSYSSDSYHHFLAGTVSLWDRAAGTVEKQYDLFDYINPEAHQYNSIHFIFDSARFGSVWR